MHGSALRFHVATILAVLPPDWSNIAKAFCLELSSVWHSAEAPHLCRPILLARSRRLCSASASPALLFVHNLTTNFLLSARQHLLVHGQYLPLLVLSIACSVLISPFVSLARSQP